MMEVNGLIQLSEKYLLNGKGGVDDGQKTYVVIFTKRVGCC